MVLVLKLFLLPVGGQPGLRATEIAVVGQRLIIAAMAFEKGRETVVRRSAGGFGIGQVIVSALQGHIMARCDDHTKLGVDVAVEIGRDTSELQSLMRISYAVFCLKKKRNIIIER